MFIKPTLGETTVAQQYNFSNFGSLLKPILRKAKATLLTGILDLKQTRFLFAKNKV